MAPARIALAAGGLAALAAAAWLLWGAPGSAGRADPDDAEQVALGRTVYEKQCASCHGERLEGQANWRERKADGRLPAPPHDATGHTWHHPDDALFGITKRGLAPYAPPGYESDMQPFAGTLTDEEIWAALAYIKSRWPPAIRERQKRISETAKE